MMIQRIVLVWIVINIWWFLPHATCFPTDNCLVPPVNMSNECFRPSYGHVHLTTRQYLVGENAVNSQGSVFIIQAKNPNKECTLMINIADVFKKFIPSPSIAIYQVLIHCYNPARLFFCRPENFTANDIIVDLRLQKQCRVTGADLAVWGRAADLRFLRATDDVAFEENRAETASDLEGLFNIGTLRLSNLKNKTIPRIFLSHVWEKMADVQLWKMSLKASTFNRLKITMPQLQSLNIFRNNLRELPDFPWCNRSLGLPLNLSRTLVRNKWISGGATINPAKYPRYFFVDSNPLMRKYKILAGNLNKICLRGNNLKFISSNFFYQATNLEVINLSTNKLTQIPERIFEKTPHLAEMYLGYNKLTSLNGKTFKNLTSLRKLYFRNNSISKLQNGFIGDELKKLEEINFENNYLRVVETRAFSRGAVNALKKIYLRGNKLREVPQFGFSARNLYIFDVSENEINFAGLFRSIDGLDVPNFEKNQTSKKILNLKRNKIEQFDVTKFNESSLAKFVWILRSFVINLRGNPLHCDCKTRLLQIMISNWSNTVKDISEKDFECWVCHTPRNLRGMNILSVPPEMLKCEDRYPKCPAPCTCYPSGSDLLIFVDCRRRNLTAMPDKLPNGLIELHLEHNEIENLTFSMNMENVTLLNASHNKIQRINLKYFPLKLKEFYLESNKLTTLPKDLQSLTLSRIDLQNNFFTCGCENYWMKNWLKRDADAFIGGADSLACSSGETNQVKQLVLVKDADFICKMKETETGNAVNHKMTSKSNIHFILISAVAGFLFLVLVSAAFLYRYRKELKLLLYTRFKWHPFDRVDDLDPSKTYDAFVSFNRRDVAWVMETLRDKLEGNNPPYKLCIHCRDFTPGTTIAENILDSVKTSRRMIMVLSKNFIQSEWCMLEFRAAHRRVLKRRANYLIIVLFDDVNIDKLDEELKLYLKTNTYLSVRSKWFWQQLKYALPQKKLKTSPLG